MSRIWNFSAGPAALPEEVLCQAQEELLDWHGAGCSVMEMSHRGKEFTSIIEQAEADLRELMGIPEQYKVLFLQGGATQQFAQIPMNLLAGRSADYIVTGSWSKKAYKEAQRFGNVRMRSDHREQRFYPPARRPRKSGSILSPLTCTSVPTKPSTASRSPPSALPIPACRWSPICPRTSCRGQCNVEKFGLIYAGAQKNIGPFRLDAGCRPS